MILVLLLAVIAGILFDHHKINHNLYIEKGDSKKIKVWHSAKSSDKSVASVDKSHRIVAKKDGTAVIKVRKDFFTSYVYHVTVCSMNAEEMILEDEKEGELTCTLPGGKWMSEDETVAEVFEGKVRTVGPGSTVIHCSGHDLDLTCRLYVPELENEEIYLKKGGSDRIKLLYVPQGTTYESGNPAVATVAEDGTVTGAEVGKTQIICRCKDYETTVNVSVVALEKSSLILGVDQTYQLSLAGAKWSTEDKYTATVDKTGKVRGIHPGKTKIKAKFKTFTFTCEVSVAAFEKRVYEVEALDEPFMPKLLYGGDKVEYSVKDRTVAYLKGGKVYYKGLGTTEIVAKTGEATVVCTLRVNQPTNIRTKAGNLPSSSRKDRVSVTIHSYPKNKKYTVYNQSGGSNLSGKYPRYMPWHGCAACSLSVVLGAYGVKTTPQHTVEAIEPEIIGPEYSMNYSKDNRRRMPLSLYGITCVLDHYNINNEYVRFFDDETAKEEITSHLLKGRPVIIEVRRLNRSTGQYDKIWTNSYHTLVLLGITDSGKYILADPANRDRGIFGEQGRIKLIDLSDILPYMYPCTETGMSSYFESKNTSGGYILIEPY